MSFGKPTGAFGQLPTGISRRLAGKTVDNPIALEVGDFPSLLQCQDDVLDGFPRSPAVLLELPDHTLSQFRPLRIPVVRTELHKGRAVLDGLRLHTNEDRVHGSGESGIKLCLSRITVRCRVPGCGANRHWQAGCKKCSR